MMKARAKRRARTEMVKQRVNFWGESMMVGRVRMATSMKRAAMAKAIKALV